MSLVVNNIASLVGIMCCCATAVGRLLSVLVEVVGILLVQPEG